MEKGMKGSIIIGIAIIIAGIIIGGSVYLLRNKQDDKKIEAQPTDFKKVSQAADKVKANDLSGAEKLLAESYNERMQVVLQNRQTGKRLLKAYEEAMAVIERDEKLLARYLFEIGSIKAKKDNYKEANAYYIEAVKLDQENSVYLNGLGLSFKVLGMHGNALQFYEKALAIDKKEYGENADTARDLNNIGGIWDTQGDYKKAMEYYKQAEAILLKTVGNNHPYMELVRGNIQGVTQKESGIVQKGNAPQAPAQTKKPAPLLPPGTVEPEVKK